MDLLQFVAAKAKTLKNIFKLRDLGRVFCIQISANAAIFKTMKFQYSLLSLLFSISFLSAQTQLSYWTFDADTAGASFDNGTGGIQNSGMVTGIWNHGKSAGFSANGAGQFIVANAESGKYRKFPANGFPMGAYTTGKYRLEMKFASWKLDPSNLGSLAFEVTDSGGKRIVGWNLFTEKGTESKIRFSAVCASGWQDKGVDYASHMGSLNTSIGLNVAIEFDLDVKTVTYFVDGAALKTITDFTGTNIGQLKFFTDGKWTKSGQVVIDQMGLVKLR